MPTAEEIQWKKRVGRPPLLNNDEQNETQDSSTKEDWYQSICPCDLVASNLQWQQDKYQERR